MTRKKNNKKSSAAVAAVEGEAATISSSCTKTTTFPISPDTIKGTDENGHFYNSHDALLAAQARSKEDYYRANDTYWASGGYNGKTDDEAMIGDTGGVLDGEESLSFLDRYLGSLEATSPSSRRPCFNIAVDLGAGVGRVTKLVLLKRYSKVWLFEGDQGWSKRSRIYLGKKRSSRCSFIHQRLDDITESYVNTWSELADIMWVQWTLQYMIDEDVVNCLKALGRGLRAGSGRLIVKENRPYGKAREDRFQMDLPSGENSRYDITRPDKHHRLLFHRAGFTVDFVEKGAETYTYALALK